MINFINILPITIIIVIIIILPKIIYKIFTYRFNNKEIIVKGEIIEENI